jgi:hypothetical protein
MNAIKNPWFVDAKPGATTNYLKQTHVSTYLRQYKKFHPERLPPASPYYVKQFPGLKPGKMRLWVSVRCCFHEDTQPSLRLHLISGAFRCFACGAKGGDVLAFQQLRYNMTFRAAVSFFGAWGEV